MEILSWTQRALAFVGFISGKMIFRSRRMHSMVSTNIFATLIAFVVTGTVYIVRHLQVGDYENGLHAANQVAGTIPLTASFLTIIYHREKVDKVIDTFQQISDKCELKASSVHFRKADRVSELFFKVAILAVCGGHMFMSSSLALGGMAFYYVRDGHIEPRNLYLPHKMSLPITVSTFVGWACNFLLQVDMGVTYAVVNITTVTFVLASGLYFLACKHCFREMLSELSAIAVDNPTPELRLRMKSSIIAIVHFHQTTKSIFNLLQDVLSGTICFQLLMNVVFMSIVFFDLELAIHHLDPTFVVLVFIAHTGTGTTFAYCFSGSLTTAQFFSYADICYESDWYNMPIDMQKLLRFVIIDAQRPQIFRGYGIIDSNLTTFTKIMRTVITYYMMFKKLTHN